MIRHVDLNSKLPDTQDKLHMPGGTGHTVRNCPDTKYGCLETENTPANIRRGRRYCPHLSGYRGQNFTYPDTQGTLSTPSGYRQGKQRMSEYREKKLSANFRILSRHYPHMSGYTALSAYVRIPSTVRLSLRQDRNEWKLLFFRP